MNGRCVDNRTPHCAGGKVSVNDAGHFICRKRGLTGACNVLRRRRDCAPMPGGQKAPRRAKSREAEHHHRSSGSLGNPVGNDKGRIGSQLVINPKNEKSVGAKVMGEAGVISKAVVETEIDRAV